MGARRCVGVRSCVCVGSVRAGVGRRDAQRADCSKSRCTCVATLSLSGLQLRHVVIVAVVIVCQGDREGACPGWSKGVMPDGSSPAQSCGAGWCRRVPDSPDSEPTMGSSSSGSWIMLLSKWDLSVAARTACEPRSWRRAGPAPLGVRRRAVCSRQVGAWARLAFAEKCWRQRAKGRRKREGHPTTARSFRFTKVWARVVRAHSRGKRLLLASMGCAVDHTHKGLTSSASQPHCRNEQRAQHSQSHLAQRVLSTPARPDQSAAPPASALALMPHGIAPSHPSLPFDRTHVCSRQASHASGTLGAWHVVRAGSCILRLNSERGARAARSLHQSRSA